ncbi:hypothetical protein LTR56_025488 [Elasticomyces elasticus]|nr:hypothetical protein LTR56_025488 [Elasticomyces elasticus]KAK3649915.1 hypothetical protein LTR22_012791 [Elasticomyces elasticus]KAK4918135.1 hypothetical protein LTR49_013991 [Elasticomyces elasticus]KAK5757681.1 hypothetical protein LTS12_012140 [Elasticomyces elasticus]
MASQHIDLLTRLPFELALDIFGYLPLLSAWKLQLVSKQWRIVLTTPKFLAPRLAQDGRLLPSLDAEICTSTIGEQVQRSVRHMKAMRLGRPFSYLELPVKLQRFNDQIGHQSCSLLHAEALHGRVFAYATSDEGGGSNVVLHDLTTRQVRRFCGTAGEAVMAITLTEEVLGFVTLGSMLYTADLRAPEKPAIAMRRRDAVYCIHYFQDWRLTVFTVRPPDIDAAGNAEGLAQNRNTLGRRVNAHHRNQYEHPIAAFVNDLCIVTLGHYSWESMPAGGPSGRVSVFWFDEASTLAGGYDTGFWTDGEEARFPWTLDLDRQYVIPEARDSVAAARKG